jgi:hypothetical protein
MEDAVNTFVTLQNKLSAIHFDVHSLKESLKKKYEECIKQF